MPKGLTVRPPRLVKLFLQGISTCRVGRKVNCGVKLPLVAYACPGERLNTFMSVSTVMLSLPSRGATGFIALSFFCSLREKSFTRDRDSGVLGIVNGLNGQLLNVMLERKLPVEPPFDPDDKTWNKPGIPPWTLYKFSPALSSAKRPAELLSSSSSATLAD